MDFNITEFIKPELLILIPVIYILGIVISNIKSISNTLIPIINGSFSIILCTIWTLSTSNLTDFSSVLTAIFTAITQGLLVAGGATYVNQIIKQAHKKEEINEGETNE